MNLADIMTDVAKMKQVICQEHRRSQLRKQLICKFREMHDMTLPECSSECKVPYSCCHASHCAVVIKGAFEDWDQGLEPTGHPTLPLMGIDEDGKPTGCIAAPHLRPLCTLHTCSIHNWGFKRGDQEWTERYFILRGELGEIERQLVEE